MPNIEIELFQVSFFRPLEGGRSKGNDDPVDEGIYGAGYGQTAEEASTKARVLIRSIVESSGGKFTEEQFIVSGVTLTFREQLPPRSMVIRTAQIGVNHIREKERLADRLIQILQSGEPTEDEKVLEENLVGVY